VPGHSALLISTQRFTTAHAADEIIVLEDGKVAAIGSHKARLGTSGYYRNLATRWLNGLHDEEDIHNQAVRT
jgi:ABC-type transport system involved in Fe-S cluster assembly fused permease/ATPase subunit